LVTWCFSTSRCAAFSGEVAVSTIRAERIGSLLSYAGHHVTVRELEAKGVSFIDKPHLIAPMEDHDLWMTFFKDPAGTLALMQEAPKG
jgi:hypothetical protein